MNSRTAWIFGAGMNLAFAIVGAMTHNVFVLVWNMIWLGISIYVVLR